MNRIECTKINYYKYINNLKRMIDQPTIILDANAFITGTDLLNLGATHRLVTTPQVLQQLRDPKTRDMMQKFVFKIQELHPSQKSIIAVKQFAKKTGDIASLSDVDIQLLSLAYTLYVDKGLENKLRKSPPPIKQWQPQHNLQQSMSQDQQIQEQDEGVQENYKQQQQQLKQNQTQSIPQQKPKETENEQQIKQKQQHDKSKKESENEDDQWIVVPKTKKPRKQSSQDQMGEEEGWVTPQNFDRKMAEGTTMFEKQNNQQQQKHQKQSKSTGISLMTADFAMQNVAIQMGVELLSLDGRQIKQIRRWIMQCYLCFKQYKLDDNQVRLCKQCGYNSLSKISYSINPNGQMILHRKKGWKPNQKVLEWKQKKYEQQQKKKKHQHARRKKQPSIFES